MRVTENACILSLQQSPVLCEGENNSRYVSRKLLVAEGGLGGRVGEGEKWRRL